MGTITQKLSKLLATKSAIKQAIIAKGQSVADTVPFADYPAKIAAIQTGIDTSDATAAAANILSGKTAYAKGAKLTGTIASKTASDLTASGATVTVPAGHYASKATKSVQTATQATPTISVDTAGKITASATQTAGYVSAGTKSATKQLTTQAAQTITPGTAAKTAVSAGKYTTGEVKVAGDTNLQPSNIKSGTNIFGVTGACTPNATSLLEQTIGTFSNGVLAIQGENALKATVIQVFFRSTILGTCCLYFWSEAESCYYGFIVQESDGSGSLVFDEVGYSKESNKLYLYVDPMAVDDPSDKFSVWLFK